LGIPKRIGYNYRNRGKFLTHKIDLEGFDKKHVALYYMDLLKLIGLKSKDNFATYTCTSKEDDRWADSFLEENGITRKFILGIVPGGGKSWGNEARYRRWPVAHFAHVADRIIKDFRIPIILFGDNAEIELCKNMESFMHEHIVNIAGKTNVGQFMALVKRCGIIFCNEGGPLHISVALNRPTVSIFGPVDEKIYGPYSQDMSRHIVVSNRKHCKPCYSKFKHKKCESIICLNSISEDEVYNAVKLLMERVSVHRK